ncbi:hypothetical protein HPP92_027688, partial [Vanilla planifolia]
LCDYKNDGDVIKAVEVSTDEANGIVSNEDFKCIKELKDEGYRAATFEIPSSEQLSAKRLNPIKLEAHIRSKLNKKERVALIRAGRSSTRRRCRWLPKKQEQLVLAMRKKSGKGKVVL